jgi:hypothetical protein
MNKIVLYCKSYKNDLDRVIILSKSINNHNIDNIPFYISVPEEDIELFKNNIKHNNVIILSDKEIDSENSGWVGQQIVKSQFWKLGICDNYVCLDSDTYFIKDFTEEDFIYDGVIPYTICHEDKELMEWSLRSNLGFDIQKSFKEDRDKVMNLFNRKGTYYDFGPSPVIWNCKVWESLFDNYMKPNNLSFKDLISFSPSEFTWYGEWLLISKIIPLYPKQPLMKVFHYGQQYQEAKQKGYTENDYSKNYLGIIMQSNWGAPLKYE